ncbi:MAG: T9SS type A sorting domain-containing protein [Ignavibacteria bacterium]|jgi:hypothetical protein
MKKYFISLLLLISSKLIPCFSQTQFQIAVGGTNYDCATCIINTSDGGYAVAGWTYSFGAGGADFYIVKISDNGIVQWKKTIGGTLDEQAFSIIQTIDGGYVVAGFTKTFGAGLEDMYIVKITSTGSVQWSKTVGGSGNDRAYSVINTSDGGYVLAGYTTSFGAGYSDLYIVKLDGIGTLQWSRTVGGNGYDYAYSIVQTIDSNYVVAGASSSYTYMHDPDVIVTKLNSNGNLLWCRTVGVSGFGDGANAIIQSTDGGYVIAGGTDAFSAGSTAMYIIKFNEAGTLQWSTTVGGPNDQGANSIIQTIDGGYIVTGFSSSFGAGNLDIFIVKLYSNGTLQWGKTVGGVNEDQAYSVTKCANTGYAVAGTTKSFGIGNYNDMFIVTFDTNWNSCGNTEVITASSETIGTVSSRTPTVTSPNSVVTSPTAIVDSGGTVLYICGIGIKPISSVIPKSFFLSQNYPNPFNPTTKIKFDIPPLKGVRGMGVRLIISDLLGREVTTLINEQLNPGTYEVEWDGTNYPSGVYFYRLVMDGYSETKKMVLIK